MYVLHVYWGEYLALPNFIRRLALQCCRDEEFLLFLWKISLSCLFFLRVTVKHPTLPHPVFLHSVSSSTLVCWSFKGVLASGMFQWLLNTWALNFVYLCLWASQRAVSWLFLKMRTMLIRGCLSLVSDHLKCSLIWEIAFKLFTKRFWLLSSCRNFCWVQEKRTAYYYLPLEKTSKWSYFILESFFWWSWILCFNLL